jgi:phospholipase/carboxylesterase
MQVMSNFLPHIEIESGPNPTAAVIWLHGLGADENDFAAVVPQLQIVALDTSLVNQTILIIQGK